MSFLAWIPMTSPIPIKSFHKRLVKKWGSIGINSVETILYKFNFTGAKVVGKTPNGNTILRLNKDYALGDKGTELELPRDHAIFKAVKRWGSWELGESEFLSLGLRKVKNLSNSKTAFLDIGANTGLVTLQAINLSKTNVEVFLFEPIPRHISGIQHNLRSLSNIHINEFALSNENGTSEIFTQTTNHGNTSMLKSVVPSGELVSTKIKLVDTAEYCNIYLNSHNNFIIKCDIQGMDALVLSRIPKRIWKNTEVAVIEVWALPEIQEKDVTRLLAMFEYFEYASWNPDFKNLICLNEVSEYWLSKIGTSRNLFVSKSPLF